VLAANRHGSFFLKKSYSISNHASASHVRSKQSEFHSISIFRFHNFPLNLCDLIHSSQVSSLFVALGLNDIEVLYQKLSNAFSSSEPESIDVSSASDWQKPPAVPTSSVSDPSKSTDVAEFDFQMTPDALDSEIEKFLRESSAASAPEKKSAKSGGVKALRKLSRSDSRESNLSASPRTPSGATSTHDGKTSNKSDPSESETARGKRHSFEHEVQSSLQIITQHAQAFNSKGNVRASSTTPHAAKMNDGMCPKFHCRFAF
jgi:hypothetical protein